MALSPLRPTDFFARPWSGDGEWVPPRRLRRVIGARRFRFRSFTTPVADGVWLVHDTTTWEDGREERRDGTARLIGPDRVRFTYDDMPGGTEIRLRADGFTFAPYTMLVAVPLLPVPLLIRANDSCTWDAAAGVLLDAIDIRLAGLPLGRQVMRLRPEDP